MQARQYIREQLISVLLEQNGIEDKTFVNPDTGREIKISSALTYDKDSSAFQKAKSFISKLFGKKKQQTNTEPVVLEPKPIETTPSEFDNKVQNYTDEIYKRALDNINTHPREAIGYVKARQQDVQNLHDKLTSQFDREVSRISDIKNKVVHPSLSHYNNVTEDMNNKMWEQDPWPNWYDIGGNYKKIKTISGKRLKNNDIRSFNSLKNATELYKNTKKLKNTRNKLMNLSQTLERKQNKLVRRRR